MDSRHVAFGTFACVAVWSAWKWYRYSCILVADSIASENPVKPVLTRDEVIAIVKECSQRADDIIDTHELALASQRNAEDRSRMADSMPHVLKLDLDEMQAAVFAEHNVVQSDVEVALHFFCSGAGRNRACVDAASQLRKKLGRHLITKQKLLRDTQAAYLHVLELLTPDVLEELVQAAQAGMDFPQVLRQWTTNGMDEYLMSHCGMTSTELLLKGQALIASDAEFAAKFQAVHVEGPNALQQSVGRMIRGGQ